MSDFVIWLVIVAGDLVLVPDSYAAASTVDDLIHDAGRTIAFGCVPRIGRGQRPEPFQHDRVIILLRELAVEVTEYPIAMARLRPDA